MSKTEILDELPKLTKIERQEIRLRLAELISEDWLDDEDPLTVHEKALLEARLAAYAKDPDAGSTGKKLRAEFEPALVATEWMNWRLIIRPEDETDLTDAAGWYHSREPGLGLLGA